MASEQIRQSDVTRWGIAAIVCGSVAVLSISLSGLVPYNVSVGLHSTRLHGGNVNLLREQVAHLKTQHAALERGSTELESQIRLSERDQGELVRRISALESAVPSLLEALPLDAEIDAGLATGSVEDETAQLEAEGGTVAYAQSPLFSSEPVDQPLPDPMPVRSEVGPVEEDAARDTEAPDRSIPEDRAAFGMALGEPAPREEIVASWPHLRDRVGTLMIGLAPMLKDGAEESGRLIAGPLGDLAEAEMLCTRIRRLETPCLPVKYDVESTTRVDESGAGN